MNHSIHPQDFTLWTGSTTAPPRLPGDAWIVKHGKAESWHPRPVSETKKTIRSHGKMGDWTDLDWFNRFLTKKKWWFLMGFRDISSWFMIAKLGATSNNYGPSLAGLNHPFGITIFRADSNFSFANFGIQSKKNCLVVWNMNIIFPYIGNDHHVHIFQRGRLKPPTSTRKKCECIKMYQGNIWIEDFYQHHTTNIQMLYPLVI